MARDTDDFIARRYSDKFENIAPSDRYTKEPCKILKKKKQEEEEFLFYDTRRASTRCGFLTLWPCGILLLPDGPGSKTWPSV